MASKWEQEDLSNRDKFDWDSPNGVLYGHYWGQLMPAWNERLVAMNNLHLSEIPTLAPSSTQPIDTERFGDVITGKGSTSFASGASEIEKPYFIAQQSNSGFILPSSYNKQGVTATNLLIPETLGQSNALPEGGFDGPLFRSRQDFSSGHVLSALWFREWYYLATQYNARFVRGKIASGSFGASQLLEDIEYIRMQLLVTSSNKGNPLESTTQRRRMLLNNVVLEDITVTVDPASSSISWADHIAETKSRTAELWAYSLDDSNWKYAGSPSISSYIFADVSNQAQHQNSGRKDRSFISSFTTFIYRYKPKPCKAPEDGLFVTPKNYLYGHWGQYTNSGYYSGASETSNSSNRTLNQFGDLGFGQTEDLIVKEELTPDANGYLYTGMPEPNFDLVTQPDTPDMPVDSGHVFTETIRYRNGFNGIDPTKSDIREYESTSIYQEFDLPDGTGFKYFTPDTE